jgi:hypothetical protein
VLVVGEHAVHIGLDLEVSNALLIAPTELLLAPRRLVAADLIPLDIIGQDVEAGLEVAILHALIELTQDLFVRVFVHWSRFRLHRMCIRRDLARGGLGADAVARAHRQPRQSAAP